MKVGATDGHMHVPNEIVCCANFLSFGIPNFSRNPSKTIFPGWDSFLRGQKSLPVVSDVLLLASGVLSSEQMCCADAPNLLQCSPSPRIPGAAEEASLTAAVGWVPRPTMAALELHRLHVLCFVSSLSVPFLLPRPAFLGTWCQASAVTFQQDLVQTPSV